MLLQEEWDEVIVKDISYKRTLQIALLVGCIVGFGGLTYMLYKKWENWAVVIVENFPK